MEGSYPIRIITTNHALRVSNFPSIAEQEGDKLERIPAALCCRIHSLGTRYETEWVQQIR